MDGSESPAANGCRRAAPRSPGEAARFSLVIDIRTVAALGITSPGAVTTRTDEVIA